MIFSWCGAADGDITNGNQAFTFLGTGAFTGAGGEVRYISGNASAVVSADLDGDKAADFQVVLRGLRFSATPTSC